MPIKTVQFMVVVFVNKDISGCVEMHTPIEVNTVAGSKELPGKDP